MKLHAAPEAFAIANHAVNAQALLRMRKNEFNLNELSDSQFCGNVDCHSFLRKVVALSLKNTSALLHMEEQLDREIYSESFRTTSSRYTHVGGA